MTEEVFQGRHVFGAASAAASSTHEFALVKTTQQQLDPGVNPEEAVVWDVPPLRDDDAAVSTGTETPDGFTSVPAGSVYIVQAEEDGWTAKGFVVTNWTVVVSAAGNFHDTDIAVLVNDAVPGSDPNRATKTASKLSPIGGEAPLGSDDMYELTVPFYFTALVTGDQIWVRMRNNGDMLEELSGSDDYCASWIMEMVPPAPEPS